MFVLFFLCYDDNRDLHSFPTRRSSDLKVDGSHINPVVVQGIDHAVAVAAGGSHSRSEEHTSELQSRGHLVCRLLLEKKKQNIMFSTNLPLIYNLAFCSYYRRPHSYDTI